MVTIAPDGVDSMRNTVKNMEFILKKLLSFAAGWLVLCGLPLAINPAFANIPGGGTGTGANVTLTDSGSTVTLANGIVSIVCTKSSAQIGTINYTYNNGGGTQTINVLSGNSNGGKLYWENSTDQGLTFTYSLVVDPATTGGNYAEIEMFTTSVTNDVLDVHYSLLRGSTGFYVTAIWSHTSTNNALSMGECRDNIYAGSIFNWMSVDATRNRLMQVAGGSSIAVFGAPKECTLWTSGLYSGQYEDKYKFSADLGVQRVWGWSSVGTGGKNVGIWNISASAEYYNGGPMKRELMEHIGTTILNMHNGSHYQMGTDGNFASGEVWTKTYGPYLIYLNNVSTAITGTSQAAQLLYNDALAQGVAEQSAWPYSWFTNANYAPASNRGTITGQFVIADSGNPNASASNLWVGVVQQPITTHGIYDFQQWMKPYQFWVQSDANGNFIIPAVIAGNNYTLYAFGPGVAGTFMSQHQTGGNPPILYDLPASPFNVTVTGGATNNLGTVTWTPARVGATVFEIGYPDRLADKFRHGDDWWVGDIGPTPSAPSPIWSKFLEYPFDFPNGPNYVVGQSRWTTDWNFCQPIVTDSAGNANTSTSTITFNLAQASASGAQASIYIGLCSAYQGPLVVTVNGSTVGSYTPAWNDSDTTVREGLNADMSDQRLTFSGSLLKSNSNTITIKMNQGGYFANHVMYDYIRLELTGYVPPAPANVAAYAGNNCNLISWPVTPGATSYKIFSSTTSGSGYALIASGVTGPVCGSGPNNAIWLDTNAVNGATYYYVVQSANPTGSSANSPQSPGATPSAGWSTTAPAAPTGFAATSSGHHSVTLSWNASSGANYYTVLRSTLVNSGGGSSNTLSTIILNNTNTGTSYTDTSPTDGSIYSYCITATSAGGTSGNSASIVAVPLPPAPAIAPGSLTANIVQTTNVTLNWSAVSGAVGYVITRATSVNGSYTLLASVTETTYKDMGVSSNTTYFYHLEAVNAGGTSTNALVTVNGPPAAPASLSATAGNAQIALTWPASTGATNYILKRGISSSNETTMVFSIYSGTSYLDTNLVNGTTYYYVGVATGPGGTSPNSPEASATPTTNATSGLVWTGAASTAWDTTTTNWLNGAIAVAYADGNNLFFSDSPVTANVVISRVVNPGSVIFANSAVNYTVSGAGISGATSLVKTQAGTVTFSSTNSYTGGTAVNGGGLVFSMGAAIPASGTLTLNNTGTVAVTTASSLPNVLVNGTNSITGNGNSGTGIATLNDAGTLTLFVSGGSAVFDLTGAMTGSGNLVLGSMAMTLRFNGTAGDGNALFNLGTGTAIASVRNGATAIALGGLAGGSGTSLNGNNSSGAAVTYTLGGANTNTEFDGVIHDGNANPTIVTKIGTGWLNLTGANTYSGGTTVSGGTLLVNNPGGFQPGSSPEGSATGSGTVTVASGGTLGGNGIISGAVTVNSGGALTPGNPLGTLTIANSLTLSSGSACVMAVSHNGHTNDQIVSSGVSYGGGTLTVITNAGDGALVAGDTFQLFNSGIYGGSGFSATHLPALNPGLGWSNSLAINGSIKVVSVLPPVPVAGFSGTPTNLFVTQTVTCADASTGSITNWAWNFGDGNAVTNTSNASVMHAYAAAGSYTVSLIVSGAGGSSTNTRANYVVVKPKAAIGGVTLTTGGNLVFSGTNGPAGEQYRILTITDVSLPLASWTPVWTNVFGADGSYNYTNTSGVNPAGFFLLVSP
jgi:rhamnogalacturonan endolyase